MMKNTIPSVFEGGLVLPTYSRPELLKNCLQTIYGANNSYKIAKIIILQLGNYEVEKLVYEFNNRQTFIIPVIRTGTTPLYNINYNWLLGASFGFEVLNLPWIMSLEEDSIVKSNFINFTIEMTTKFSLDKKFRGVNLSTKLIDTRNIGTYSLLRSAMMGTGSTIILKDWNRLKKLGVKKRLSKYPWDVFTETYWKTGFRATPNISMVMNFGWIGGTHSSPIQGKQQKLNYSSFNIPDFTENFQLKNVDFGWTKDSKVYKPRHNILYNFRFILWLIFDNKLLKPIYKRIVHYFY